MIPSDYPSRFHGLGGVLAHNVRGRKLYKKLWGPQHVSTPDPRRLTALVSHSGFVEEGVIRDHIWKEGIFQDSIALWVHRSFSGFVYERADTGASSRGILESERKARREQAKKVQKEGKSVKEIREMWLGLFRCSFRRLADECVARPSLPGFASFTSRRQARSMFT